MAFFKVTDDDGEEYIYPAQKVYDDIELDHYADDSGRLFHWEAVTDDDEILSSDDLQENVEFFEDDDDDQVALDYSNFYKDLDIDDIDQVDEDDDV